MDKVQITWLGQSGFVLSGAGVNIACDLYLSDYCQQKSKLDHTRLMAIPVEPQKLTGISHYLITHGHIDHFDPFTTKPVLSANPDMALYCPPVCGTIVNEHFSGQEESFTYVHTFRPVQLAEGVRLVALPAAHEELEKDDSGEYIAMSYLLLFDSLKQAVFLAGDTIAYENQDQYIRENTPEGYSLALVLPVNGRDRKRAELGFKGNLNLDEAIMLYAQCKADVLIPCHYGMFALNDITEQMDQTVFERQNCKAIIPQLNSAFTLDLQCVSE